MRPRTDPATGRSLAALGADALDQCQARRRRVLAHPDLAHELTLSPLCYSTPEHWNGYVPPAIWSGQPNDSIRRNALVLILRAVAQTEIENAKESA